MKIVLSRKGFDAGYGGIASPIIDGRPHSLPIPEALERRQLVRYSDISTCDGDLGAMVRDLGARKTGASGFAHLDPDLRLCARERAEGWRPAFGQAGAALGHLKNRGVTAGDLFLFYGWFRAAERVNGRLQYVYDAPNVHLIWGWLQIGDRYWSTDVSRLPTWLREHPHYGREVKRKSDDCIFTAADALQIGGAPIAGLGAGGVFPKYHDSLRLTCPAADNRSRWRLPSWFYPSGRNSRLSYHPDNRWTRDGDETLLETAPRGQEFVLDCADYPEAVGWAQSLLRLAAE